MPKVLPHHHLLAEPLRVPSVNFLSKESMSSERPTPIIFCRSLVEYVLMTLTATSRPQHSPFQTSAYPPLNSASPVRS